MQKFTVKPLALAVAYIFVSPVVAEPLGLPKLEVDPALLGTPQPRREAPAAPAPLSQPPGSTSTLPPQPLPPAEAPAAAPSPTVPPSAQPTPAAPSRVAPFSAATPASRPGPSAEAAAPPVRLQPAAPSACPAPASHPVFAARPAFVSGTPPGDSDTVWVDADHIEGHASDELRAQGDVVLRQSNRAFAADWITYYPESEQVYAEGNVLARRNGDNLAGTRLDYNLKDNTGQIDNTRYELEFKDAQGVADVVRFESRDLYRAKHATYSTCSVDQQDWVLKVEDLEIDRAKQIGVARNVHIEFMNVPILYTPWMDFPLNDQRKSGFLKPTFGSTSGGGLELTIPYYWNIAPNYDATFAPRIIARRGLMLNNEFRYLEPNFNGEATVDYLPNDQASDRDRYALSLKHSQNFGSGFSGGLNLQKVSDDAYFRDLTSTVAFTSKTNLPREGFLSYSGGWWSATSRVQRFQTLQDPNAPIVEPFERAPQFLLAGRRPDILGADVAFNGEWVQFDHPTLVNGNRAVVYPTVAYPLQTAFAQITPKVGLHYTNYDLDPNSTPLQDTTRTVPIMSVDSGVTLERDGTLFGRSVVQTLEPRIFYVYIPFRNQDRLPNFDSVEADFNFAQIFTENRFAGSDRIGDANQISVVLTSRLLDPDTGAERLRFAVGERFSFDAPRVALNTQLSNDTRSDILATVTGRITASLNLDANLQYNPEQAQPEKINISGRYQPLPGKVANLGYRFTRGTLEQIDASGQWPLSARWQGVMRYNYSLRESRILETLAGLEYNGCCWAVRFVARRIATAAQDTSNSIFIQLELKGLSRLGSDLGLLRESIPGYVPTFASPNQAGGAE